MLREVLIVLILPYDCSNVVSPLYCFLLLIVPPKRCAGVAPRVLGDRGKKEALRNYLLHKALSMEDNGLEPMTF